MIHDIREGVAPEERLAAAEEPALWDVVDELLGEAEFLLEHWLAATGSLRFNLELLQASIEPRLAAQLDALAVGGEAVAARVLWPTLIEDGDASVCRRAAAGLALLWEPDGDACDRLIALLDSPAEAKLRRAVGLVLRLTARGDIVARMLRALAAAKTIDARADLIAALSARGTAPHPIEALDDLVASATDESLSACLGALAVVQHARDKYRSLIELFVVGAGGDLRQLAAPPLRFHSFRDRDPHQRRARLRAVAARIREARGSADICSPVLASARLALTLHIQPARRCRAERADRRRQQPTRRGMGALTLAS